jgi:hypothetical protein
MIGISKKADYSTCIAITTLYHMFHSCKSFIQPGYLGQLLEQSFKLTTEAHY